MIGRIGPLAGVVLCLYAHLTFGEVSFETLTFIESDGHTYTNYATTRSDGDSYTVFLDPSERLGDFLYINPNRYTFAESGNGGHQLQFEQGSYALINRGSYIDKHNPLNSAVSIDPDGTYRLNTWNGTKQANGHYGFWNAPDPYNHFAAAWVIPAQFEVVDYRSNSEGEWELRGNTLAFFATQVNNLVFEIAYRRVDEPQFRALQDQLRDNSAVELQQQGDSIKVILTNGILFASGSADLSQQGKQLLKEIVPHLPDNLDYRIIVEGHTDNVPIQGSLRTRFPSNWELSAQRALSVVHDLQSKGVDPKQLEARAHGAYQPRLPNNTPDNRSKNRRIELVIEPV
jgi:chemotaxis protein MotB